MSSSVEVAVKESERRKVCLLYQPVSTLVMRKDRIRSARRQFRADLVPRIPDCDLRASETGKTRADLRSDLRSDPIQADLILSKYIY